jgi:hypothetical protein
VGCRVGEALQSFVEPDQFPRAAFERCGERLFIVDIGEYAKPLTGMLLGVKHSSGVTLE